jgi:tetratricopeptide (TPR) repeat protein
MGEVDLGMHHPEKATEIAGDHPCYLADLCHRSWKARKREQALIMVDKLAATDHDYAEIHIMVADMLRRQKGRVDEAIALLDKGLTLVHVNGRLMNAKARMLMSLDRVDEAQMIYEDMVAWGLGNVRSHSKIYRLFDEHGRTETGRKLIETSTSAFEDVQDMLAS